ACEALSGWPTAALSAANATTVDPTQFITAAQLNTWGVDLDNRGLRATGTQTHEDYIDELHTRLACAGVTQLSYEQVPLTRWSVDTWSLAVASGASAGPVQTAAYVPYSGSTSAQGNTAPMVYLDANTPPTAANAAGKIVLFDVPQAPSTVGVFQFLSLASYDPDHSLSPTDVYNRPYLAMPTTLLDQLSAAGVAGAIGILPAPYATAHGAYYPYDRILRSAPSVFVDQDVGATLKALAAAGTTQMTLALPATVTQVMTRNLVGIIPGASDELTVINSHTDGTNGLEDNGPNAIVGMAEYLTRLPKAALPRTIMVLLSSGHFAGGVGVESFLSAHQSDGLLGRIASVVTVEHMGAQEYLPDANGLLVPTGNPELGAFFTPKIQPLVNAAYDALKNADAKPGLVIQPTNPGGDGSADNPVWPGEGQYFYGIGGLPTANYITGPYYLLNWGVTTADKIDFDRMRNEMVAFTQMQLDLSRVAKTDLATISPVIVPPGN
ncbi:MAG: hypothetical protein JWR07_2726, partial [Nevskia sp.]|nr:hypothetical protein [Nevskia sp.]